MGSRKFLVGLSSTRSSKAIGGSGENLSSMKLRCLLLALIAVFVTSCGEPPRPLRIEDIMFGNKRVGLQADKPTFQPGETVLISYNIRGFKPDSDGNASLSGKVKLEPSDTKLIEFEHEKFKVNSDLTSYGPRKPIEARIPSDTKGEGKLVIEAKDEIANKDVSFEIPYTVAP